jgi:TonB family protein
MRSITAHERPPSLLDARPIGPSALFLGLLATLAAHVLIPLAILGSQWLLVVLGLAVPVEERERPREIVEITEAELVRLGKPFDPRKLPSRKVPPVAKAPPDAVVVSPDAPKEPPPEPPPEKKERPKDAKLAALDNLIDRTKDFAEDVQYEQEGDPQGLREGTATKKGEGDLYAGQLSLFFRRNWSVPNVVQNPDKLVAEVFVDVTDDGRVTDVKIAKPSGDVYFDQSLLDAIEPLVKERASIPEPPPEVTSMYYGKTLKLRFKGTDAR